MKRLVAMTPWKVAERKNNHFHVIHISQFEEFKSSDEVIIFLCEELIHYHKTTLKSLLELGKSVAVICLDNDYKCIAETKKLGWYISVILSNEPIETVNQICEDFLKVGRVILPAS